MKYLRQSTAATVCVGPCLSVSDGLSPVTNLTSGSTLNGRAVSNGTGAAYAPASFTHDANGHYLAPLAAGDVPSVGRLRLEFSNPAVFLPVWEDFTVLSGAVYDSLFGTAALPTVGSGSNQIALSSGGVTIASPYGGLGITGQVAGSATASTFNVTLDSAYTGSVADLQSMVLEFRSGARIGTYQAITTATINGSTSLNLVFATPFALAPSSGDLVFISK